MTTERINIVVSSDGTVTVKRDIESIGTASARSSTGVDQLKGALLGLASVATITMAFRQFVTATSEAEAMQAQLAAAIRSTNGAAGQSITALNDHAQALQGVTNFGDEAINNAQALLLTFTKIGGETFPRATEAALDLATRLGGDVSGAALQLGKALQDPERGLTMLTRSGITFSQKQQDLIKGLAETNRLAEAQAIILKEVERQFGGSAVAARETLGGALQSLSNYFGDLFEVSGPGTEQLRLAIEGLISVFKTEQVIAFADAIGSGMFRAASVVVSAIALITSVLPPMLEFLDAITFGFLSAFGPEVLTVLGLAAAAIVSANLALSGMSLVFGILNPAIMFAVGAVRALTVALLTNPFVAVGLAIAGIVVVMYQWRDSLGVVGEWFDWLYNKASDVIKRILDALKTIGIFDGENATIELKGEGVADDIFNAFGKGGMTAAELLERAMGEAGEATGTATAAKIGKAMDSGANTASKAIKEGGDTAGKALETGITGGVQKAMPTVYSTIESAFATLAPLMEVFEAFLRREFIELKKTIAETGKLNAETKKLKAETDAIRKGDRGGNGTGASYGGSGSSGGGGGSSMGIPNPFGNNTPANTSTTTTTQTTAPVGVNIVNVTDPAQTLSALNTAEGRKAILNVIKNDPAEFAALLGVA